MHILLNILHSVAQPTAHCRAPIWGWRVAQLIGFWETAQQRNLECWLYRCIMHEQIPPLPWTHQPTLQLGRTQWGTGGIGGFVSQPTLWGPAGRHWDTASLEGGTVGSMSSISLALDHSSSPYCPPCQLSFVLPCLACLSLCSFNIFGLHLSVWIYLTFK